MIGHMLPGITPDNIGTVRSTDLMGAVDWFEAKYSRASV